MTNQIPKFHETFIPILKIIEAKEELHVEELKRRVRDTFYSELPQDLLNQKTSTGGLLIMNRIGWGKSYLKQAKLLEQPQRGYVKITAKGLDVLKKGQLTLSELKKDLDYLAARNTKDELKKEKASELEDKDFSPQDLIEDGFETIKQTIKAELLERLKKIDPFYFEKVILILLKRMGYGEFVETKKTGDGGIDGIINQDQLGINKIYIQAKRYSENKVREKDIRNFIGAMSGDTTNGVFVTTSTFDEAAIIKAKEAHHKIILIDGYKLTELMFEFGVGVQTTNTYEMKEVDEDFFEDSQ
jgi:restriction system protein